MPTAKRPTSIPLMRPRTSVPELTVGSFASEGRLEIRAGEPPAATRREVGERPPELASVGRARSREVVGPVGEGEGDRARPLQAGGQLVRRRARGVVVGGRGRPPPVADISGALVG